ncbi:MAG: helix-turn-helix domain-containing protein [Nevskia sp.]|nr:helix-turn-helix domain-containing protein [Nevskia sp.]
MPDRKHAPPRAADEGRMLITGSRLAYRGPFGHPGIRTLGGWTFYLALDRRFSISMGESPAAHAAFAAVPPYVPHRVTTQAREMAQVLVEAETVDDAFFRQLVAGAARRRAAAERMLEAFAAAAPGAGDFDLRFFGAVLPGRALDPRIERSVAMINGDPAGRATAASHAAIAGLSLSRFAHLFREQTQVTFRRFRAWKRARALMPLIDGRRSLVDVALSAGYADSTHFSHSVRQFYGYSPRFIFTETPRPSVIAL